ncbi:MAG TPA: rhodanese-like domain-containing protein [Jiangellaceae bacterium]|nr:rhodanese-like domain-containing protein [Jiangellaceae bacterium]
MIVIDGETLRSWLAAGDPIALVHAGAATSFREGHLPGAVAFSDVDQAAGSLRSTDVVVVYGRDDACTTSRAMAAELARRGFSHVSWYAGGMAEWVAAGSPTEGPSDLPT